SSAEHSPSQQHRSSIWRNRRRKRRRHFPFVRNNRHSLGLASALLALARRGYRRPRCRCARQNHRRRHAELVRTSEAECKEQNRPTVSSREAPTPRYSPSSSAGIRGPTRLELHCEPHANEDSRSNRETCVNSLAYLVRRPARAERV